MGKIGAHPLEKPNFGMHRAKLILLMRHMQFVNVYSVNSTVRVKFFFISKSHEMRYFLSVEMPCFT